MHSVTAQRKLVPDLAVEDARYMFSRGATTAFKESRKMKGKKLYGDSALDVTIAISSKDEDDMELEKRLRSGPPSHGVFASMVTVIPDVLTVEEANKQGFEMSNTIVGSNKLPPKNLLRCLTRWQC